MGDLVAIIGGIIIVGLLIGGVYLYLKKKNNNDSQEAVKFINGLTSELTGIILHTIKNVNPAEIESVEEFEILILNNIYDEAWDYVKDQINVKFADDSLLKTIINIIDKEYVIKVIDRLCEDSQIFEKIEGEYAKYKLSVNNPEAAEAALVEEYSDPNQYIEESTEADLAPAEEIVPTEEELAALNPQREDGEEEFDSEDESVEVIEEEQDEAGKVIAIKDSKGRWCFYEVDNEGKKSRIPRSDAIPKMKEQGTYDEFVELSKQ